MAKNESYSVRIGAAQGLAMSAVVGANGPVAISGIAQLWREKGRPRRDAAKIFADLAKKKPGYVIDYLSTAARITEDPALHPIGVEGLCYAATVGSADARRALARSTDDTSVEVRRMVMNCVADGPDPAKNGAAIAARLIKDPDGEIRGTAARVLAMTVDKGSKVPPAISDALVGLLDDPDRDVRIIGIRAVGGLGAEAPKATTTAMTKLFERADEGEKLALLRTAKQIGAAEIVGLAVADSSALVRVGAVDAALTANLRAGATLSAALADADPQVRKAALERIAAQKDKIEAPVLERALSLAARDPDPELSQLALTTIARISDKNAVQTRLKRALASRVERVRAQAAAAAIGLVDRDAGMTATLLEPLLEDASHDVRVAMLPALSAAYAKTNTPEKLADLMARSEGNAMRRLVAAGAYVTLARTDAGRSASEVQLKKLAAGGPPMASQTAKLVGGLIEGKADGMAFLQELTP
jgi:HEAT repeat protein